MANPTPLAQVRAVSEAIIVCCSGGKDSLAVLDLCARTFPRVHAVYGYLVPDLSFREATLQWAERRYGLTITRVPHWELSRLLRHETFRLPSSLHAAVPVLSASEWIDGLRERFGCLWVASGERIADSIWRRAILKRSGLVDQARHRVYPVGDWTKAQVLAYLQFHHIPLPLDYQWLGHSFGFFFGRELTVIRQHAPADYDKIVAMFPLVDVALKREEWHGLASNA